ncbi:pheromone alpha factor receptor [Fusarium austroafricanum]|uniref:Pheromone alpha factor receptor n=1 Tax=Fusarium austroafricanum TaxID=2364996 RepID=A0A8H4KK21_9HYPO|nr:pheromone alpha factor receptor [Fusarium austroafricanum]
MADFDPLTQNVTFLAPDGNTTINIPLPAIDLVRRKIVSLTISYAAQLGASLIMLAVLLAMVPWSKYRRPFNALQLLCLVVCAIRMILLCLFNRSQFMDFYPFWADDYRHIPRSAYAASVAGNTMSLVLVILIELMLMSQAWTMVKLWPNAWKYTIASLSVIISLMTIAVRLVYTIANNQAILNLSTLWDMVWLMKWMVGMNVASIASWCAIFNIKLVWHLISNHGILPYKALTPMEVLIMTNGVLMLIPVIFASMEFAHFMMFESASLTLTSVAVILPLGTLAAQRIASSNANSAPSSGASSGVRYGVSGPSSFMGFKAPSFSTGGRSVTDRPHVSVYARCEAGNSSRDHINPVDVELGKIDNDENLHVRVDKAFIQREERM